jgi:GntR family transcriptional repressor for pyruvate dehydrogenase complex
MSSGWTNDVRQFSHATRRGRRISTQGHHRIYRAICDHDPVAAQEAMVLHLQDVKDLIARAASHRGRPKS